METYLKAKGTATLHGQHYEIKLSALLYLRGINSGLDFQLAVNVDGAGALDDILFRFKSSDDSDIWRTVFIQLKHNENSQICKGKFFGETTKRPYSLLKYLKSYVEIKGLMLDRPNPILFDGSLDSSDFILYTNATVHISLRDISVENFDVPSEMDNFVRSGVDTEFIFSLNEDDDEEVYSKLEKEGDDAREFLRRFKFFTGEPSEMQLDALIMKELGKLYSGNNIDYLLQVFEKKFMLWWSSNVVLDQESGILKEAILEAKSPHTYALCDQQVEKYGLDDVTFLDSSASRMREALSGQHSVINVIVENKAFKLHATKVLQVLGTNDEGFLFLGSRSLLLGGDDVISSWIHGDKRRLVLVREDSDCLEDVDKLCTKLSDVFTANPGKQVVLLSCSDDLLARRLQESMANKCEEVRDSIQFTQLDKESANAVLMKEVVFQGVSTNIGSLFANDVAQISEVFINCLEIVLSNKSLRIGEELHTSLDYYVKRHLLERNTIRPTIFVDSNLDKTIVIEGDKLNDVRSILPKLKKAGISDRIVYIPEALVFFPNSNIDSLNEANEDKDALGNNNMCHVLKLTGESLVWKETKGDINIIKQHLTDKTDIVEVPDGRLVLLVAEPGMGKSTYLAHLAKQTKQDDPNTWVVSLAFNDHTALFAKTKMDHFKADDILVSALGIDKMCDIDQALFRYCLHESGNMVVMLDGFDEISPKYAEKCLAFVTSLLETKVSKVWVSSRFAMKDSLETHFSTLALTLGKFTEEDQTKFLINYWKSFSNSSTIDLPEFISKLLKVVAQSMNDKERDFTGIPLQTLMLAEVFQDYVTDITKKLPRTINVLELVEQFVDKKLNTFIERAYNTNKENTNFDSLRAEKSESFMKNHKLAALVILVDEHEFHSLFSKDVTKKLKQFFDSIREGADKTGIIDRIINGKPVFLHRVFAEYFAALWFAENYAENREFMKKHLLSESFSVMRHIFDRVLARNNELHRSVLNSDLRRVEYLLSSGGADVNETDDGGRTALHLAVVAGRIDNMSSDQSDSIVMISLLLCYNANVDIEDKVLNWIPLQYADAAQLLPQMDLLLEPKHRAEIFRLTTTINNFCNQSTMWDEVIKCEFCNIMNALYSFGLNMKSRFKDGTSLLQRAAKYDSTLIAKIILNPIRFSSDEQRKNYINKTDHLKRSALSYAVANDHIDSVKFLVESRASVTVEDGKGQTPLMFACKKNNIAIVEYLLNSLSVDMKRKYVNVRTKASSITAQYLATTRKNCKLIKVLSKAGADLTIPDSKGFTSLMLACDRGFTEVVNVLINCCSDLSFINAKDQSGHSALHFATQNGCDKIFNKLAKSGADMNVRGKCGFTLLMTASMNGSLEIVRQLLERFTDVESRRSYINEEDHIGKTALSRAREERYWDVAQFLEVAGSGSVMPLPGVPEGGVHKLNKTRLLSTLEDNSYKISVCALLVLRGLKSGQVFQLCTKVGGMGAFDDIVFRFKLPENRGIWDNWFIKVHQTDSVKLKRKMFVGTRSEYSLKKYFSSLNKAKKKKKKMIKKDLYHFGIYTQAVSPPSFFKTKTDIPSLLIDDYVRSGMTTELMFSLTEAVDGDLYSALKSEGPAARVFLDRLRLFTGQPNADQLDSMIRDELSRVFSECSKDSVETCHDIFMSEMELWFTRSRTGLDQRSCILQNVVKGMELRKLKLHTG